jgi:transposase-like protein
MITNAPAPRVEVITSVQRRRRWPTAEKIRLVEETMQPEMSVSYVARRSGVAPGLRFNWRRRMLEGGLQAVQADEDVVGTSRVRELEHRSSESNGIAEAFVKTFKRDYARLWILPDAATVIMLLPAWFEDYNDVHPHSGLKFLSPREFLRLSA